MKKKLLFVIALCLACIFAFVLSASAKCEECDYDYKVTSTREGFLGKLSVSGTCSVCQETVSEQIPALFEILGYSYNGNGIVQGYIINREGIARYEEVTGEKLKYGAVIATKNAIGDKNPLDNNGNPITEKVKAVDITSLGYDIFDVAIRGIPEAYKESAQMVCSLYVISGSSVTYLDNQVQKENCNAYSYDEVVETPKAEAPALDNTMFINGVKYRELSADELNLKQGYYWNQDDYETNSKVSFNNRFWSTNALFTKNEIPVGSIIVINTAAHAAPKGVWQYRPDSPQGTRPGNVTNTWVEVDESWWGNYTERGFNFSTSDESVDISGFSAEQIRDIFKIYVPVNPNVDTEEEKPDYSAQKQNWNDDGALKILAIGNSFSDDSMQYVYQVAAAAGVDNIVLGNLYIGGCTLATHLNNATNDSASYEYRTNSNGTWSTTKNYKISDAVKSEDWDFITFQQASGSSGMDTTYYTLEKLIDIVEPLNPSARLAWHMTWAYQQDSTHSEFVKYDKDQMTMYNSIVNAVKTKVLTENRIEIVIPAGTSIQNVRTSYIGDTLTRDGYHLSYDLGRFIGSLTYVKALTGLSIDGLTYMPTGVNANQQAVAIECVNNALLKPFEITNSIYVENPDAPTPEEPTPEEPTPEEPTPEEPTPEEPKPEAPEVPEGYRQLTAKDLGLVIGAFYNTDAVESEQYNYSETDTWNLGFATTSKLSKQELPYGTIIEIAEGWQYRPERWAKIGTRPSNVTTSRIVIDKDWWSTYSSRAFNISQVTHTLSSHVAITCSEEDIANYIFRVYVPLVVDDGEDEEEKDEILYSYNELELTLYKYAFYNTGTNSAGSATPKLEQKNENDGTGKKYYATQLFTKEDIPVGSVIYIHPDWNYRPEGWVRTSGGRPGTVGETIIVDEAWWGEYTQRAFNICRDDNASMKNYTEDDIREIFKIYVPNKDMEVRPLTSEELSITKNAFWWSVDDERYDELVTSGHENTANFFATKRFTREELPVGSVIVIDSAWFYRPEGWVDGAKNEKRPDECQMIVVVVTEEWWGDFTERAFNIGIDGKPAINSYSVEDIEKIFKIYVPITE